MEDTMNQKLENLVMKLKCGKESFYKYSPNNEIKRLFDDLSNEALEEKFDKYYFVIEREGNIKKIEYYILTIVGKIIDISSNNENKIKSIMSTLSKLDFSDDLIDKIKIILNEYNNDTNGSNLLFNQLNNDFNELIRLKDLNKLYKTVLESSKNYDFSTKNLNEEFKKEFKYLWESDGRTEINFEDAHVIMTTTRKNNIISPNISFYQAALAIDFNAELLKYKKMLKYVLDMSKDYPFIEFTKKMKNKELAFENIDQNFSEELQMFIDAQEKYNIPDKDRNRLLLFATDYSYWYGKKTIGRHDFNISAVLSSLQLSNASSEYIAKFVNTYMESYKMYGLAQDIVEENIPNNSDYNNRLHFQNKLTEYRVPNEFIEKYISDIDKYSEETDQNLFSTKDFLPLNSENSSLKLQLDEIVEADLRECDFNGNNGYFDLSTSLIFYNEVFNTDIVEIDSTTTE